MVVIESIAYAHARVKKATSRTKKKAAAKKPVAPPRKKKAAALPKKSAAPKKKATRARKKIAAAPKKKAKASANAKAKESAAPESIKAPPKKRTRAPTDGPPTKRTAAEVPPSRPSQRAMAVAAQLPQERALTDEEREAMSKVALTALSALDGEGPTERIVSRIATFVDEIRGGLRPEPTSQDIRLGLGVLWGEQVRAQVGWRWVHLSYANGFASYALVPDDRAFACFPLNRLAELMKAGAEGANTSVPLFDSILVGTLPARRENAYLVIG